MTSAKSLLRLVAVAAFVHLARVDLRACVACFGQSDSSMAQGMNMGIFALLLVITGVLATISGFFIYLARRGAQMAETRQQVATHFTEHRTNA
jgi:hypothetical protein